MRCKFGGSGEDDEEIEDIEKRELEQNGRRGKHSIDGILGDRCEWALRLSIPNLNVMISKTLTFMQEIRKC